MAESVDRVDTVCDVFKKEDKMESLKYFSLNLELAQETMEMEEEIVYLEKAIKFKNSNNKLAALLSKLKEIQSASQFIIDRRVDLRQRLRNPVILNAIPVKYKEQMKFITCCQKLPVSIEFLESLSKEEKINRYHFLSSSNVFSQMSMDLKLEKKYISHLKYFLSSCDGFLKNFNSAAVLFHGDEIKDKTLE